MHVEIPQIFWHGNRDRIMSIDFYPNSNYLVTSGAESENKMYVKLWRIEEVLIDNINSNLNQAQQNPLYSQNNPINQNQEDQKDSSNSNNNNTNNNFQTLTDPENTSNYRIKPVF